MRSLWGFVVLVSLALGCGATERPLRCGPREDLIGAWRRSGDGAELRLELDATFELEEAGVVRLGRYLVDDRWLYLHYAGSIVGSPYCVERERLVMPELGGGFVQLE
jgi:hypothetical protein